MTTREAELFQTTMVVLFFLIIGAIVYLMWSFSTKLFGALMMLLGVIILTYFPGTQQYQAKSFTMMGRVIGAVLLLLGILIFVFA